MKQLGGALPVEEIRRLEIDASQRLLGDTIGISDAEWRAPSLLPGWSRAHVATHLARDADLLRELTRASLEGREPQLLDAGARFTALEQGADRDGLALQIDLDTSAGRLGQTWDDVVDWQRPIHFEGGLSPLALLPLVRLHEICLHQLDLDRGFEVDQLDRTVSMWLLAWVVRRRRATWRGPTILLHQDSGETTTVGDDSVDQRIGPVSASDARLWAWLSGRLSAAAVSGAAGYQPALLR